MTIARILAPLSGGADDEDAAADRSVATTALAMGKLLQAQVRFLHVAIDPAAALPLLGEGMSGAMAAQLTEDLTGQAEKARATAEGFYRKLCEEQGLTGLEPGEKGQPKSFSVALDLAEGVEEEQVTARAKLSDLVLVAHPGARDAGVSPVTEGVLFNSGRPVLVVPKGGLESLPKRMAVAWNGSAEAARAVALAMPILLHASEVVVISGEGDDAAEEALPSALADLLAVHGLQVSTWRYQPDDWPVGRSLITETRKSSAGLLVMGAYGHSRMREMLLGGATREALRAGDLGLLMAH